MKLILYIIYLAIPLSVGRVVFDNLESSWYQFILSFIVGIFVYLIIIYFENFFIDKMINFIKKKLITILTIVGVANFYFVAYYLILIYSGLMFWIYGNGYPGLASYPYSENNIFLNIFYLIINAIGLFSINRVISNLEEKKSLISMLKHYIYKNKGEKFVDWKDDAENVKQLLIYAKYITKRDFGEEEEIPKIDTLKMYLEELEK